MRALALFTLLIVAALSPAKAATFIQVASGSTFSGTSLGVSLTGVGVGHSLRFAIAVNATTLTITNVSDGTHTATIFPTTAASGTWKIYTGICTNCNSGSVTLTATASGTVGGLEMMVEEWSGDATGGQPDGMNATYTADGTAGTDLPAGSFTMTNSTDDIWTVCFQEEDIAPTVPSGYTAVSSNIGNAWWTAHKASTGAGSINPTWVSASGDNNNVVAAAGIAPLVTTSPVRANFFAPSFP